jgi:Flp pilus assembly protein TadD
MGRHDAAVDLIQQAIAASPRVPAYHMNLGVALDVLGRDDDAIAAYHQAIKIQPQSAQALCNLGKALGQKGRLAEAIAVCRQALQLQPDFVEARNNLGNALQQSGAHDEAVVVLRRAILLRPNYAEAHGNLGKALLALGAADEAVAELRKSISLRGNAAETHGNLGSALAAIGEVNQAIASFRQAIALNPAFALGHFNLGLMLLLNGEFELGWPEYEWRLRVAEFDPPVKLTQPPWDGTELNGRRILIHAEQGLGDVLQFVRYLPKILERGGQVILHCQRDLHRLLQAFPGITELTSPDQPLPAFDMHCPLLSLPRVFQTNATNIPAAIPYLTADETLSRPWQSRLEKLNGRKVGLVWAGRPAHGNDRNRSIALKQFAPLASAKGIHFISLQKGEAAKQAASPPTGLSLIDWTNDLNDFADTAALVANLDLVITIDSAVAHLAGALGKPVWLLLPWACDWRWMLWRSDSPWYPTLRLFRQRQRGDWSGPIKEIAEALPLI